MTYWIAVGDVDADGFPDIVEVKSDGTNGVFLNRPGETERRCSK